MYSKIHWVLEVQNSEPFCGCSAKTQNRDRFCPVTIYKLNKHPNNCKETQEFPQLRYCSHEMSGTSFILNMNRRRQHKYHPVIIPLFSRSEAAAAKSAHPPHNSPGTVALQRVKPLLSLVVSMIVPLCYSKRSTGPPLTTPPRTALTTRGAEEAG